MNGWVLFAVPPGQGTRGIDAVLPRAEHGTNLDNGTVIMLRADSRPRRTSSSSARSKVSGTLQQAKDPGRPGDQGGAEWVAHTCAQRTLDSQHGWLIHAQPLRPGRSPESRSPISVFSKTGPGNLESLILIYSFAPSARVARPSCLWTRDSEYAPYRVKWSGSGSPRKRVTTVRRQG